MVIQSVIFDLDNTVADTLPVMSVCVNQVLSELDQGHSRYSPNDLLVESPIQILRERGVDKLGIRSYWSGLRKHIVQVNSFPGVRSVLIRLASEMPLSIQTSLPRMIAVPALGALGLEDSFRHVVAYHDVTRPKPAPDGILLLSDRLAISPEVTLVVGDAQDDIQAARNAGALSGVALWSRGDHRDALAERPKFRFHRPEDITEVL